MLALIFDSVGFGEWFVLLAVVLIVVGPEKLPSAARSIGNCYAKFRRAAESFKRQIMDMETEFGKAAENTTRDFTEAFSPDGDEGAVTPNEYGLIDQTVDGQELETEASRTAVAPTAMEGGGEKTPPAPVDSTAKAG